MVFSVSFISVTIAAPDCVVKHTKCQATNDREQIKSRSLDWTEMDLNVPHHNSLLFQAGTAENVSLS